MSDSTRTTIRRRILDGELLFGAWADTASPLATEITGRAGFDWLMADLEHGAATEAGLMSLLMATELSGSAAFVRPQSGERLRIGRALDLGAAGIMVPRLDTAAQAEEAVSYLRYPPDGVRGVALRTRGARHGTVAHADIQALNRDIVGIIQIESPSAVREADAIAAIDGVDVLFVGPADLSHSLRVPGRFDDPTYLDALDTVVAACRRPRHAAGVRRDCGSAVGPHHAPGFRFLGVGSEGSFIAEGAKAALAAARSVAH